MSLRDRLEDSRIVVAVGAHDPLTATIAQQTGMEAVYHGGYAVAAHHYGVPDIGMVGLAEITESLRRITTVSTIPVLVDADTGYGAEPGVRRTVQQLEAAGASAVQLEDQVFPKRCGHMAGKQVIPRDEMVLKVRAAAAERRRDTVLVARTDALQVHGLDDAIDRCNAYAEAGADLVFVDAPGTKEQLAEIAQKVDGRQLVNMSETGRTPAMSASELEALGYSVVIFPSTQTWLFAKAYRELCEELLAQGTTQRILDRFMSFDDVNSMLGIEEWQRDA